MRKNNVAKRARPEVKATSILGLSEEDEEILATNEQEIDTEKEEWAKGPGKKSSFELEFKGIDYTKKY